MDRLNTAPTNPSASNLHERKELLEVAVSSVSRWAGYVLLVGCMLGIALIVF